MTIDGLVADGTGAVEDVAVVRREGLVVLELQGTPELHISKQ